MPHEQGADGVCTIAQELDERLLQLEGEGKLLEAQRLDGADQVRPGDDPEVGYCAGIENYCAAPHRPPTGRASPYTLIDYFPKDYLLLIDESHVTLPQLPAMYNSDQAQEDAGRAWLPPAHRPGQPAAEVSRRSRASGHRCSSSAPRRAVRAGKVRGEVVEQVIRPTGLVDPIIDVRPAAGQVPDLMAETGSASRRRRARARDHADQAAWRSSSAASCARRASR